ncbi:MAG: reductive dehalogenase [Chloroflexi bacterium]|nr:reductive dehalogenase [Chloroflexota bacterium]
MPENLTRREFLKDLGLVGAGVSLAPAMADGDSLDSFLERADDSWKPGPAARPAWVKTVDKITMEVDWPKVQRYSEMETLRHEPKYIPKDRYDKLQQMRSDNLDRFLKTSKPGYTLKDFALQDACGAGAGAQSFLGPQVTTPDKRGVPAWTGSPEDAARMVTVAMRHMGAATVGFVQLETNTTEKLIYSIDPDKKEMVIADVDMPAENDKQRIIPKKARTAIVYTVQMSQETLKRAPAVLGSLTTSLTYTLNRSIQLRAQTFLKALGYMALGESSTNALAIAPALGVFAGLGEMSRYNRLITPEYGPMVRVFKLLTDLPIATTKPIDAGLFAFCQACTKCADACPSKALSFGPPTWEVVGGWNNPGHKAFFEDSIKCRNFQYSVGTNCGLCFAACPFASKNNAFMHAFRNAMAATVPAFDGVLRTLDDVMYGAPDVNGNVLKDCEAWWKLDLPEYGMDSTQGHRDGYA